jgi:hypothetical protein
MTPATMLRDRLTDTVTELDRVLAMVSSADGYARELHSGFVEIGIRDVTITLVHLRRRLDDATKRIACVRDNLDDCAEVVRRDVIGTGDVREPPAGDVREPPAGEVREPPTGEVREPPKRRPPVRHFDWLLVRMLMGVAGFAVATGFLVFDSWLHLVSISDDLYQPVLIVLVLGSVSVGLLDRHRIPRRGDVAFQQFLGVALAGAFMVADVAGWQSLTAGSAATAIILLALNTAVGVVVLPRLGTPARGIT